MDCRKRLQRRTCISSISAGSFNTQLAIYLGYVDYKILGATVVGLTFVIPSFLMVLALGFAYIQYGGLPWMQAVLYGIGAAVIGIISIGMYKLTKKSLGKELLLWIIFAVLTIVTFILEKESIWAILSGGINLLALQNKAEIFFGELRPACPVSFADYTGHWTEQYTKTNWLVFLKNGCICVW